MLPESAQQAVQGIFWAAVLNFGFLSLFFASTVSPVLVTFLVIALVAFMLLACHEDVLRVCRVCLSSLRTRLAIEPAPQYFDFEDEASFIPPEQLAKSAKVLFRPNMSTRSGMFTEAYSTKLKSGKLCVVQKRAYPFQPFSDTYQMDRRYGVVNLLDKDTVFIGAVGRNDEEYEEVVQSVKLKLHSFSASSAKETGVGAMSKLLSSAEMFSMDAIPEEIQSPKQMSDDDGGINFDDTCDIVSVLSVESPRTSPAGSPVRLRPFLDTESKMNSSHYSASGREDGAESVGGSTVRSMRTSRTAASRTSKRTHLSGTAGRFGKYTTEIAFDQGSVGPLGTPSHSVAGGHPPTSSFLTVPTTPDGSTRRAFAFAEDRSVRSAASKSSSAATSKSPTFGKPLQWFPQSQPLHSSGARTGPGQKSPNPRNVCTSSLRYRKYTDRAPRYTDVAVAGPGGAAATVSLDEIKHDEIGLPVPTTAPERQNLTPSYFMRQKKRRHQSTAEPAAASFVGPGRILVAHELNELPSFPLMY